jgi:hypothetical protein
MTTQSLPLSLAHGAAAAHVLELHAEARRHARVRALTQDRVGRGAAGLAAIRASVAHVLPGGPRPAPAACPTC